MSSTEQNNPDVEPEEDPEAFPLPDELREGRKRCHGKLLAALVSGSMACSPLHEYKPSGFLHFGESCASQANTTAETVMFNLNLPKPHKPLDPAQIRLMASLRNKKGDLTLIPTARLSDGITLPITENLSMNGSAYGGVRSTFLTESTPVDQLAVFGGAELSPIISVPLSKTSNMLMIPFIGVEAEYKAFLKPPGNKALSPYTGVYTSFGSKNMEIGAIFDTTIPPSDWQGTFFMRFPFTF